MAGTEPTPQQLAQQIIRINTQLQQVTAELDNTKGELQNLKDNQQTTKGKECGGLVDRKHMMIEKLDRKEGWVDFAECFIEYLEEIQPVFADQLVKAQKYQEVIEPIYHTEQDKKVAHSAYKLMKKYIKGNRRAQIDEDHEKELEPF